MPYRPTLQWLLLATTLALPMSFGIYPLSSEEAVLYFSSAFDLTPFFPGSNRTLSFIPALSSPTGNISLVAILSTLFVCAFFAIGIVVFLFQVFPNSLATSNFILTLIIIIISGSIDTWSFYFSSAHPYLAPLGLTLLALSTWLPRKSGGAPNGFRLASVIPMTLAIGINPTSGLFAFIFILLIHMANELETFLSSPSSANAAKLLRSVPVPAAVFATYCIIAVFGLLKFQEYFASTYPGSVVSNYSTGSYSEYSISLKRTLQSLKYALEFHERGNLLSPLPLLSIAFFVTLVLAILPISKRWRMADEMLRRAQVIGQTLFVSSIVTFLVLSTNSHIRLVDNMIQGRYYTMLLGLLYLALTCLTLPIVLIRLKRTDGKAEFIEVGSRWACVLLLPVVLGSIIAQRGLPNFRAPTADSASMQVLKDIESENAAAMMGDYWVIWILQLYAHQQASGGGPAITPIAIRSEAFSLRVYSPIVEAVIEDDRFGVACVHKAGSPGAPGGSCDEQFEFFMNYGALPRAKYLPVGRTVRYGDYEVAFYEGQRAGADNRCVGDAMLFRADLVPTPDTSRISFALRPNGFVVAPVKLGTKSLTVTIDGTLSLKLAPGESALGDSGGRAYTARWTDCRIIVSQVSSPLLSLQAAQVTVDMNFM